MITRTDGSHERVCAYPLCQAHAAISTRFRAAGLSWTLDRCVLTVESET